MSSSSPTDLSKSPGRVNYSTPTSPRPIETLVKKSPLNYETADFVKTAARTPVSQFYIRTNFDIPRLDAASHAITLRPLTGAPVALTLPELLELGTVSFDVTLECAGNDRVAMAPLPPGETWRGGAVSSTEWTGVPLRRVLERFGMAGAPFFVFRGADSGVRDGAMTSFERALDASMAMSDGPMLVVRMNGQPLPVEHGGPVRLLVPGWYAMASVKWLTHIEARAENLVGHFQTDRYVYRVAGRPDVPVREMLVKSIISTPASGDVVDAARLTVRGWAWSGAAEITRVEISVGVDAGWAPARLLDSNGRYAWRGFEYEWTPSGAGHHIIRSRATDATGATQPDVAEWNALGYGNNAIQTVSVNVR